ncbi:hypothetical protein HID58_015743 [Brassica napus]|uniref:Transmembrane protein n=1 Tax=Brassica napus TaxID=3708 RepID=A0ABQ8DKY2_BRANA|nr:hypothetical protein HID58_015743 [Brassica napus]
MKVDNTCQVCGKCLDTQNHLLFEYRVEKEIWSLAKKKGCAYGRGETTLDILKVIHDALRDSSQWHEEKQKQYSTAATITKVRNTESASMIHDIIEASKSNEENNRTTTTKEMASLKSPFYMIILFAYGVAISSSFLARAHEQKRRDEKRCEKRGEEASHKKDAKETQQRDQSNVNDDFDEDVVDAFVKQRNLRDDSSPSCFPPANEERVSVLGFEAFMLGLLLVSGSAVYYRKKQTVRMAGVSTGRTQSF